MEPIQSNHDRREPILRMIASDSFFPNPLSPFRQGPLPLQWPEIPSSALHLLDAGPVGEATYVLCRNLIAQMNTYENFKYLNSGEIDQDMIDHHSWPEFYFSGFICTTA